MVSGKKTLTSHEDKRKGFNSKNVKSKISIQPKRRKAKKRKKRHAVREGKIFTKGGEVRGVVRVGRKGECLQNTTVVKGETASRRNIQVCAKMEGIAFLLSVRDNSREPRESISVEKRGSECEITVGWASRKKTKVGMKKRKKRMIKRVRFPREKGQERSELFKP